MNDFEVVRERPAKNTNGSGRKESAFTKAVVATQGTGASVRVTCADKVERMRLQQHVLRVAKRHGATGHVRVRDGYAYVWLESKPAREFSRTA